MKLLKTALFLIVLSSLSSSLVAADKGTYKADWQSLKNHQNPSWLADDKFGIFIHWLPNSVPAYNDEWYARWMYKEGHDIFDYHKKTWGDQGEFGYKDFIPMFNAENWDPVAWAKLFKEVGARYVVPNAEHHCHFALWDSELTRWDAKEMGPKRDIIGELSEAVRAEGMKFGVSNHRARGWDFFTYDEKFDTMDPEYADFYWPQLGKEPDAEWLADWEARLVELVDKYQPDMMWFDYGWGMPAFEPYKKDYITYYYNQAALWNKQVGVVYKGDQLPRGAGVLDVERGKLDELWPDVWMTDTSVFPNTWGYVKGSVTKPARTMIHNFIDIISKNGVLLLNIGPKPDGTIPQDQVDVLKQVGGWIKGHGEAIYSSRPFDVYGEGDGIRFTRKDNKVFVFFYEKPQGNIELKELSKAALGTFDVTSVKVLNSSKPLEFDYSEDALRISTPKKWKDEYAWVLEVELSGVGYSRPATSLEFRAEGGAVFAKGKVYNFTEETQVFNVNLFINKHKIAAPCRVKLAPGESTDVRYEHRDQNHYGARSALISDMAAGIYSFRLGDKRPESGETKVAFPCLSTQGGWKFMEGDDQAWSAKEFNDEAWKAYPVHGEWPLGRVAGKTGWYRREYIIPQAWDNNDLFVNLGVIKGDYTIYVNGEKMVDKPQQEVEFHFSYEIEKFIIPAGKIKFGEKNTIAIRLHNYKQAGLVGPSGSISVK